MKKKTEVTLHPHISPLVSYKVEKSGVVMHVVLNGGGGMGGSREHFYGLVEVDEDGNIVIAKDGLFPIQMLISDRTVRLNPAYIGNVEIVQLWKETIEHTNNGCGSPSPTESYFVAHRDTKIKTANRHDHEKSAEKIFGLCNGENF
jgi:hypothetical protein